MTAHRVERPAIERIGVGLAALGRPAYLNVGAPALSPQHRTVDAMRNLTAVVLDSAYANGVRWVDAARSYGSAEEFLGSWLNRRGHGDVTVSSKWGYAYVAEWRQETEVHEVKEHSVERLHTQWDETRAALGDRVSLYQVHSLTTDSPLFEDLALQHRLANLRDEGVRIGFSTSGARQAETVERAWDLEVGGAQLFGAVQSTWNALEPSAGTALAEVHHGGWTVLVKESLANGRLAVDPPQLVNALAESYGVGPDAVALAYVLDQPWVDVVLVGPSSVGQLESNLTAATLRLSATDRDVLAAGATDPATYWGTRASLPWN